MTTPRTIIGMARQLYNDTVEDYRKSDDELVEFFNDGVKALCQVRPDLFQVIGDMVCVPGACEQALAFTDAQALVDVLCIHDGAAITPFDMQAMDLFNPSWRTDTAGPATQWSRKPNDPLRFFIYPKAPAEAQTIDLMYVRIPTTLAIDDTITEVPSNLFPALVDYIVYRVESADDEHVVSERAAQHYKTFLTLAKGGN